MRNDGLYEIVLKAYLQSKLVDDTSKTRYQMQLEMLQKNQIGATATDFSFLTSEGEIRKLSDYTDKPVLLIFYDPTCTHCAEVIAALRDHRGLNNLIEHQQVRVLAIAAWSDQSMWKDYQKEIPNNWINGYDKAQKLIQGQLYSLRASPTIYLLDKGLYIREKDIDFSKLLNLLSN